MAGSNGHVIRHGHLFLRKSDFWSSEAARIRRYGRLRRWTGRVARGLGGSPEPDVVGAGGLGGEPVDGLNRQVGHGRIYYHHSTRTAPRQSHVRPRRRGSTRRSSRGTPPPSSGMERPGAEVRRRAYPAAAPRLPSRFRLTVGPSSWLSLPPTARSGSWWPMAPKAQGQRRVTAAHHHPQLRPVQHDDLWQRSPVLRRHRPPHGRLRQRRRPREHPLHRTP